MKRERRILAIVGDGQVVIGVLYRGKLWFESLEVKVFNGKRGDVDIFKSKYLDQARTVLIDEGLLKHFKADSAEALSALISRRGDIEVIIVREEGKESASLSHEKVKRLCIQGDVPEALRVAKRIFNEVRNIMNKTA